MANILPRVTLHNWDHTSNWTQRVPDGGALRDRSIYRHSLQLTRPGEGDVMQWDPLTGAMADLRAWLGVVIPGGTVALPGVPQGVVLPGVPAGYELRAWFTVHFDLLDRDRAARTEQFTFRRANTRMVEQALTRLIEKDSGQKADVHWLDMFAIVVRRPSRVQLAGDGEADEGSSSGAPPPDLPRGRGRPPKQQQPKQRGRPPAQPGPSLTKKRGKRRLEAKPSASLIDAVVSAVLGGIDATHEAHDGAKRQRPGSEADRARTKQVLLRLFAAQGQHDTWEAELNQIEAQQRSDVAFDVYDEESRTLLRRGPSDVQQRYTLAHDAESGGFVVITDREGWFGRECCPYAAETGCTYTAVDANGVFRKSNMEAHVAKGSCLRCRSGCGARCRTIEAFRAHAAETEAAPCAKPVPDPRVRHAALPAHQHDAIFLDAETSPDEAGVHRARLICIEAASERMQSAFDKLDTVALGGMMRTLPRVDGKHAPAPDERDAPHFTTRPVPGDRRAAGRKVCEQFFAMLELMERRLATKEGWYKSARRAATHYLLSEWYWTQHASAADDAKEEDECDACDEGEPMHVDERPVDERAAWKAHKTWHTKTRYKQRERFFNSCVLPALAEAGVDARKLLTFLNADASGTLEEAAHESYAELREVVEGTPLYAYARRRRHAVLSEEYRDAYRRRRAERPVIVFAHNNARFDSLLMLDFLAESGRLRVPRSTLVGECAAYDHAEDGDVALRLTRDDVKVLDTSNHCFIDVTYKGFIHFRDTARQLPDTCAANGKACGVETLKGCQAHALYEDQSYVYADRNERYKPSRSLYVTTGDVGDKARNPMKRTPRTLLSPEEYRLIPGKDPDGNLDGVDASGAVLPYNSYREDVAYCTDDVRCMSQFWRKWRETMIKLTSTDGSALTHTPLFASTYTIASVDPGPKCAGLSVVRALDDGKECVLHWEVLEGLGYDEAGATLRRKLEALPWHIDALVIEQQPIHNDALTQVASIMDAFPETPVHLVDAGFPKTLDPTRRTFPTPTNEDHKEWALGFAPTLLEGVSHPPWPWAERMHDLCDATLQAIWWLRKHRGAPADVQRKCPCCTRRWHTHGADPNCFLTMGQMTMAICKSTEVCTEVVRRDGEWHEVKHSRPRFLPHARLPKTLDELAAVLDAYVHPEALADARVLGTDWKERAPEALHGAVCALAEGRGDEWVAAAMARLRKIQTHFVPVLDKAKDQFCRRATYGGRTEVFEKLFELLQRRRCANCPRDKPGCADCWGSVRGTAPIDVGALEWELAYIDANSLYPAELLLYMPCGPGEWISAAELAKINADPAALEAFAKSFYGFLEVDVCVPKKGIHGRYPVLSERVDGDGSGSRLEWNCHDKVATVYATPELQAAIARGAVVTKVHRALRFEPDPFMRAFISIFRDLKESESAKPDGERNDVLIRAVKQIINGCYGKCLQRIHEAESRLVDDAGLDELLPKEDVLYMPTRITDGCWSVTLAKPWRPASTLPPSVGCFVLALSKVRWYRMLEVCIALGGIPLNSDTDSLWMALPRPGKAALDAYRAEDASDVFANGIMHDSTFGLCKDELPKHRILGLAVPTGKFYSMLLATKDGVPLTERLFPQSRAALVARLEALDTEMARTMLPCARAQPDVLTEAHYDLDALSRAWAVRMRRDETEVRTTVEALARELPYVYTKCKANQLRGNEEALGFASLASLVLGERDGIDLERTQVVRASLGATFLTKSNTVTARYAKRAECERNPVWEAANGALRVTTVPHGYEGDVW
jgi:hypothetical protein